MKFKALLLALSLVSISTFAQEKVKYTKEQIKKMEQFLFNEGFPGPSTKKISTIILKNGTVNKGFCNDIETKKGQIYEISTKDSATKKQMVFNAENVSEMYIYPTKLAKILKVGRYMSNVKSLSTKKLNKYTTGEHIQFVNQTVSLKNKKDDKEFLMQLINPEFNDVISVYHDARAKETGGMTVGFGMQVSGGVTKSYYVKKGDKVIWLHKDDFEDNYDFLFGDNAEFMKKYPKKSVEWDYFSFLVNEYTEMTNG
ncbi:hypothetical protein CHRY9390_00863 [Chryseobacterium aquaeductus]|uniref:Uncharacterized protein n=1 Tax=Chryseobacterium aquaeductus TaxID=2675056 RepID=A0A9N8QRP3_9FLAO|nr:hypothetical protein [Chryseobacterium aquaeductus]CAA7330209.1 hypothetical protein CHRY9390_00863 [Chryseobacterium potabilaquae]CAD7802036.1 hypothetical protein CHRY9390_00863 [Chryseobacterium aquaeductus]